MNKSKFKAVKFLPFDLPLTNRLREKWGFCWTNEVAFGNNFINEIYLTDSCIEQYPELFEVEKADREFEDGAYYKVRFQGCLNYEVALCRINPTNGLFTFTIPDYKPQYKEAFQEVGEKIELEIEL
jgi:hypothetical protein